MSSSALQSVANEKVLFGAWKHIRVHSRRERGGTSGIDGQRPADFRRAEGVNVREISRILKSGNYRFRDLRLSIIEKSDGGKRIICIPTVRDRIVQRAILKFLTDDDKCGILNGVSYGFTKNKGVRDAALHAVNVRRTKPWVYKTDISKYFDEVDRDRLKAIVKKKVKHRSLHRLLIDAACREIHETHHGRANQASEHGITVGRGIRQGMPLSPFFSNLFLHKFDGLVEDRQMAMLRYADDLIFLCETERECLEIDAFCREELGKIDLRLPKLSNQGKTRIYPPDVTAEFLGLGLIPSGGLYVLDLTPKQKDKIRRRILKFGSASSLSKMGVNIFNYGTKLDGKIAGYLGTYSHCASFDEFSNALVDLRRKVTRQLFTGTFGIKFSDLDDDAKAFLCVGDRKY